MALINNETTTGLSLLDADELGINEAITSAVNAVNSCMEEKINEDYFVKHLLSNQFYLPNLLIVDGAFVLSFFDRNYPATPRVEYIENVPAKDGKPARLTLSIGNDIDQMSVSYAIQADSKVKPRDYIEKIDPSKFPPEEIAKFLLTFIEPPIQIQIPDGEYDVVDVSAEAKSTILTLSNKMKVRVNTGCSGTVTKIKSLNGFVYSLSAAGHLLSGISIVPRGVPLVGKEEDNLAKVGDQYTFLGVASLPTEFGFIHTALVEDEKGNRTYTKVDSKIPTLVLTKLSLKKVAVAKISTILSPGGKRVHYSNEWTTR
jgi:hypothetical protein